jgi:hypothetical protein
MWCLSASTRNWANSWLISERAWQFHSRLSFSDGTRERQMSPTAATKCKFYERAHQYRVIAEQSDERRTGRPTTRLHNSLPVAASKAWMTSSCVAANNVPVFVPGGRQ